MTNKADNKNSGLISVEENQYNRLVETTQDKPELVDNKELEALVDDLTEAKESNEEKKD